MISTQTFDTTARNDQETWEALRRELEDIGISPGVITEKRQFIITWFQEAVAAGRLEEDVASVDNNSTISLHESEDSADSSDDSRISNTKTSSTRFEPSATQVRAASRSEPRASSLLRQPHDRSSPLPQKKGNSRIRVTYLLQKLLGREDQFLQAAKAGNVSAVRVLLDKGVNIHAKDGHGETALHRAAMSGHKRIVDLLLEHGADTEWKGSFGGTALIAAARNRHQNTVQLLIEKGANIESENEFQSTALMYAAIRGDQDIVRLLLDKGAQINSRDSDGRTALSYAEHYPHKGIAQMLRNAGARL